MKMSNSSNITTYTGQPGYTYSSYLFSNCLIIEQKCIICGENTLGENICDECKEIIKENSSYLKKQIKKFKKLKNL